MLERHRVGLVGALKLTKKRRTRFKKKRQSYRDKKRFSSHAKAKTALERHQDVESERRMMRMTNDQDIESTRVIAQALARVVAPEPYMRKRIDELREMKPDLILDRIHSGYLLDSYGVKRALVSQNLLITLAEAFAVRDRLSDINRVKKIFNDLFWHGRGFSSDAQAVGIASQEEIDTASNRINLYNSVIYAHAMAGRVTEAENAIHDMVELGMSCNVNSWCLLLKSMVTAGRIDEAEKHIKRLEKIGIPATVEMMNEVLVGHLKAGNISLLKYIYRSMPMWGIDPDTRTYNIMIKSCIKPREVEKAFLLIDEMETFQVKPDDETFLTLMRVCCEAPFHVSQGYSEIIQEAVTRMQEVHGIPPNRLIYNATILACGRSGDMEAAEWYFYQMASKGIEPSEDTYLALINGYAMNQNMGERRGIRRRWLPDAVSRASDAAELDPYTGPEALQEIYNKESYQHYLRRRLGENRMTELEANTYDFREDEKTRGTDRQRNKRPIVKVMEDAELYESMHEEVLANEKSKGKMSPSSVFDDRDITDDAFKEQSGAIEVQKNEELIKLQMIAMTYLYELGLVSLGEMMKELVPSLRDFPDNPELWLDFHIQQRYFSADSDKEIAMLPIPQPLQRLRTILDRHREYVEKMAIDQGIPVFRVSQDLIKQPGLSFSIGFKDSPNTVSPKVNAAGRRNINSSVILKGLFSGDVIPPSYIPKRVVNKEGRSVADDVKTILRDEYGKLNKFAIDKVMESLANGTDVDMRDVIHESSYVPAVTRIIGELQDLAVLSPEKFEMSQLKAKSWLSRYIPVFRAVGVDEEAIEMCKQASKEEFSEYAIEIMKQVRSRALNIERTSCPILPPTTDPACFSDSGEWTLSLARTKFVPRSVFFGKSVANQMKMTGPTPELRAFLDGCRELMMKGFDVLIDQETREWLWEMGYIIEDAGLSASKPTEGIFKGMTLTQGEMSAINLWWTSNTAIEARNRQDLSAIDKSAEVCMDFLELVPVRAMAGKRLMVDAVQQKRLISGSYESKRKLMTKNRKGLDVVYDDLYGEDDIRKLVPMKYMDYHAGSNSSSEDDEDNVMNQIQSVNDRDSDDDFGKLLTELKSSKALAIPAAMSIEANTDTTNDEDKTKLEFLELMKSMAESGEIELTASNEKKLDKIVNSVKDLVALDATESSLSLDSDNDDDEMVREIESDKLMTIHAALKKSGLSDEMMIDKLSHVAMSMCDEWLPEETSKLDEETILVRKAVSDALERKDFRVFGMRRDKLTMRQAIEIDNLLNMHAPPRRERFMRTILPKKIRVELNMLKAQDFFLEMLSSGLKPTNTVINSMINVFGQAKRIDLAIAFIKKSETDLNFTKDKWTYRHLIDSSLRCGNVSMANCFKREAIESGVGLDKASYGLMIRYLAAKNDVDTSLKLLEEADAYGMKIEYCYLRHLRNRCTKLGISHSMLPADPEAWLKDVNKVRKKFGGRKRGKMLQQLDSAEFNG